VPSFQALLSVHLVCALTATVAFWLAAFSGKGGPFHRAIGKWFQRLIYAVAFTGGVLALAGICVPAWGHPIEPGQTAEQWAGRLRALQQTMWVVLYMLLIIITPAQHGLAVVAAGAAPARVRSRLHATLNLLCLAGTVLLLAASVVWQRWIFLTLAPIGFTVGLRNMSYAGRTSATSGEWEREHLTSLVTTGVTMHTALLMFGVTRTLGLEVSAPAEALLWLLPACVGVPAILWLRSRRGPF
jgi:hypothetical protein